MAVGDVEETVLERQIYYVGHVKCRIVYSSGLGDGLGQVDLRLLHIDAVHLAGSCGPCQPRRYPQPKSRTRRPGLRFGSRYAALVSAVYLLRDSSISSLKPIV